MKQLVFYFFFFSFFPQVYGQQIEFKLNVRINYGYAESFDNRFRGSLYENYSLDNTGFYGTQKVKSMSVYDAYNRLYRYFEFDTMGTIIKRGAQNYYYYTENSYLQLTPSKLLEITSYYLSPGGALVRRDSVYRIYTRYEFADTVIAWTKYITSVYKRGDLINEQNEYYNTRYYNKKVVINNRGGGGFNYTVDEDGELTNINPSGHVFIKKLLKSDYKPGSLYKCSKLTSDDGFYASCNNGHKSLNRMDLLHHRLAKKFSQNNKTEYFTDGEWFVEPVINYNEPMDCGHNREHRNEPWINYSTNAKGLYDTCFSMYLVPDTSRAARKKHEKDMEKAIKMGAVSFGEDEGPYKEKPERQLLYYFRYSYY